MNGLHHALYVAAAIAFAGAADRGADDPQPRRARTAARERGAPRASRTRRHEPAAQARLPAAERRAAIVAAALEVFGAGSYARSTTAEIARVAGVSEPIIYRHFPSKKELWFASLDEAWRQLRDRIEHKHAITPVDR